MYRSEEYVKQQIRLAASAAGVRLWRNNVGVLKDIHGRPVRFGLCNDSPALNKEFKSGDFIGITPHVIMPPDIGTIVGVFTSIEAKKEGWRYTGKGREVAQNNWINLITSLGGIAKFSTGGL
jgi:hypothetical protein